MAGERCVQTARAFRQRGEARISRGEPHAGTHGGDIVEVVPGALQLEQDGPCTGQFGSRTEAERLLASLGVGDSAGNSTGGAGARDERHSAREGEALSGPLEAAVLIEEARVEVEDAVAHHVEPEMPRLDDAGMDRPDHHLVGVTPLDRHRPAAELGVVVDERAKWLMAREADAVQVVRLALVPVRSPDQVDEGGNFTAAYFHCLDLNRAAGCGEQRAHERPIGGRVEPGKAASLRKRVRDTLSVRRTPGHEMPFARA